MKIIITYHRDSKQMLYASVSPTDPDHEQFPDFYVLNEKEVHAWERFTLVAEMPIYEFKDLFVNKAVKIFKRRKETWN